MKDGHSLGDIGIRPTWPRVGGSAAYHGPSTYRDDGCQHSPSCLTCPLPECVHDVPLKQQEGEQIQQRALNLYNDLKGGMSMEDLVAKYKMSSRTVWRDIRRAQRETCA